MSPPGHILIVCTANVCRSPMAARLLQHALAGQPPPLSSLHVVSAGLAAAHGQTATENSVVALKKVGVDLSAHQSQPLTQPLLDGALAVLCMTETHRAMIQLNFARVPRHIYLFREFMDDTSELEIPDPYGMPYACYESCRDSMVEAIPSLLNFFRKLADGSDGR